MKKIYHILFLTIFLVPMTIYGQGNYYWYKGQKVHLTANPDKKFLLLDNVADRNELISRIDNPDINIIDFQETKILFTIVPFQEGTDQNERKWAVVEDNRKKKLAIADNINIIYEQNRTYYIEVSCDDLEHQIYHKC